MKSEKRVTYFVIKTPPGLGLLRLSTPYPTVELQDNSSSVIEMCLEVCHFLCPWGEKLTCVLCDHLPTLCRHKLHQSRSSTKMLLPDIKNNFVVDRKDIYCIILGKVFMYSNSWTVINDKI